MIDVEFDEVWNECERNEWKIETERKKKSPALDWANLKSRVQK